MQVIPNVRIKKKNKQKDVVTKLNGCCWLLVNFMDNLKTSSGF